MHEWRGNGRRDIQSGKHCELIAHRDYSIPADIELNIYADRLEIISPGALPNTITVERMRAGCRAARNELIKDTLRDYRYVEDSGLGIPRTIIPAMRAHNDTEPQLVAEENRFILQLLK